MDLVLLIHLNVVYWYETYANDKQACKPCYGHAPSKQQDGDDEEMHRSEIQNTSK